MCQDTEVHTKTSSVKETLIRYNILYNFISCLYKKEYATLWEFYNSSYCVVLFNDDNRDGYHVMTTFKMFLNTQILWRNYIFSFI